MRDGCMAGELVGPWNVEEGEPLLVPVMDGGEIVHRESQARAREQLAALPEALRGSSPEAEAYPVEVLAAT